MAPAGGVDGSVSRLYPFAGQAGETGSRLASSTEFRLGGRFVAGRLVIVGAGQAAFAMAAKLRALKDERPILILGEEPVLPYQRPPLSKKYLLGEMEFDRLLFRPEAWYAENAVEIRLGVTVTRIDRAAKTVVLESGEAISYETLALVTGATPRRLPASAGGDLAGIYTMRSKADADRLAGEMQAGRRLLVIGGGYIGLEAAAVARKLGLEVTVIEMAPRILQRVAAPETARTMREIHEAEGVTIRENTGLRTLVGTDGHVSGAELSDGTVIPVDIVIAGIGVTANDRLAAEAGLETANGIVVDAFARTADPAIYAAGDCTVLPWKGQRIRLESVQNAIDQAEAAAAAMAGGSEPYEARPWFWSDQYEVKLQIAGFNLGYDETLVRPGLKPDSSSVWYFREGRLIACDAINDARAYVVAKRMIELGITPDKSLVRDPEADLKALLKA